MNEIFIACCGRKQLFNEYLFFLSHSLFINFFQFGRMSFKTSQIKSAFEN
jgi:hypothetical protein